MHKLAALRRHLIDSPLAIVDAKLDVYATQGHVRSGGLNTGFEISYTANILIRDFPGDPDTIFYLVLGYLRQDQPDHDDIPITWDADILDHRSADLYLAVPLTETVSVIPVEGGVELRHCGEESTDPVYLSASQWTLFIDDVETLTWTQAQAQE